jgi:hypothetical protein
LLTQTVLPSPLAKQRASSSTFCLMTCSRSSAFSFDDEARGLLVGDGHRHHGDAAEQLVVLVREGRADTHVE